VRAVYVPLPGEAHDALVQLAEQEWRHPKDQAVVLLLEALRQRGALNDTRAAAEAVAAQEGAGRGA
jgi:hypothetical protein